MGKSPPSNTSLALRLRQTVIDPGEHFSAYISRLQTEVSQHFAWYTGSLAQDIAQIST
jgi:hypothetical protein